MPMPKRNLLFFNALGNAARLSLSDYGHAVYAAGL